MDEADRARIASRDAVEDVESVPLGDEIHRIIDLASMTPGALTILTARELGGDDAEAAAAKRAAGVQLSYEGLRLTRQLVREQTRWDESDRTDSYVALLVAEVMVSRGFFHLAHTEVAPTAIDIVQRFSRNQLLERELGATDDELEASLEVDVIKLGIEAGATLVSEEVPPFLAEFGEELAAELDTEPLPEPDDALADVPSEIRSLLRAHSVTASEEFSQTANRS